MKEKEDLFISAGNRTVRPLQRGQQNTGTEEKRRTAPMEHLGGGPANKNLTKDKWRRHEEDMKTHEEDMEKWEEWDESATDVTL